MTLQGKTALVTGSAAGLGRAIADLLLSRGANVVVCDINPARTAAARAALAASHPDRALVLDADVADESSVQRLVAQAVARFGALDVVVNNAALMDRLDPAPECSRAMWDAVLAVNLTGPFLLTKYAIPHMLAQAEARGSGAAAAADAPAAAGGLIINIASIAATHGFVAGAAYTSSKHGLLGLTKNTAVFYGRQGVYSVALLPGPIHSTNVGDAFAAGTHPEGIKMMFSHLMDPKVMSPENVARYVAFLCEDGISESANGSCIELRGGCPGP